MEEPNSRALKHEHSKVASWGFDAFTWLACMAYLWGLKGLQKEFYLWDSAILWDGAARMAQGLSPFTDFGMPVGPVSLWLPSLFFKAFGISWPVFKMAQLFINGLMLASLLILFRQMGQGRWVRLIGACVFSVGYLALLWAPWYNTTAVLLVMLAFNLVLVPGLPARCLLGGVAALCLFAKQDFGVVLISVSCLLMALTPSMKLRPSKDVFPEIGALGLGLIVGVATIVVQYESEHFRYWFNYGQSHHAKRIPELSSLFCSEGVLGLLVLIGAWKFSDRNLLLWALFVLMALITRLTSGQLFSHFYFLAVLVPIMAFAYRKSELRLIRWGTFGLCLLVLLPIAKHVFVYLRSDVAGLVVHPVFANTWLEQGQPNIVDLGACDIQSAKLHGSSDSCQMLTDLKKLSHEKSFKPGGYILNMSEATHLSQMLNLRAPAGHPLWYHEGISYFPREHQRVLSEIENGLYEVIVLTDWGPENTGLASQVLAATLRSPKYTSTRMTYQSSFSLSQCKDTSLCRISVFVRSGSGSIADQAIK